MAGTILTTITTLPVWTNKLCRTVSPNRSWWSQQWIRRIIHVTNWMAGTILTSSPHYFSAVEDYHACLMKNWGYLAEQTKDPQITLPVWTNKLCTTSLRGKDSIFYANRLVTSMYWVVKWATLRKPKLIRIGPQGAPIGPEWKTPAYMNHQRKSYKWRLGLALSSIKAHWRAKAQQAYPASKQAQAQPSHTSFKAWHWDRWWRRSISRLGLEA